MSTLPNAARFVAIQQVDKQRHSLINLDIGFYELKKPSGFAVLPRGLLSSNKATGQV